MPHLTPDTFKNIDALSDQDLMALIAGQREQINAVTPDFNGKHRTRKRIAARIVYNAALHSSVFAIELSNRHPALREELRPMLEILTRMVANVASMLGIQPVPSGDGGWTYQADPLEEVN